MVRNYVKKRTLPYSDEDLRKALQDIEDGSSIRAASTKYNIPRPTLQYRLKNKLPPPGMLINRGRFSAVFSDAMADELKDHIVTMQKMFYGLSSSDVRRLAFQFAESNHLSHPFNKEKKIAGQDWLDSFMKNSGLSLRTPEATSMARVNGFSKEKVHRFYENLDKVMRKRNFAASQIYNVDETGVTTVQVPKRIIAQKGMKQVGRITSAERGKNITVVGAINASGGFIPPMVIYPRVRKNPQLEIGAFPGTLTSNSKSGWIDADLFVEFLKHFVQNVHPSEEYPVLLLLDGHVSHKSLKAIEYCRQNYVTMVTFPPHTSNKLQPLDLTVYGPFKTYMAKRMDKYMSDHPGERISDYIMVSMIKETLIQAFTPANIMSGFQKAGIMPYNPNIFKDEDFMGYHAVTASISVESSEQLDNPSTSNTKFDDRPVFHHSTPVASPVRTTQASEQPDHPLCDISNISDVAHSRSVSISEILSFPKPKAKLKATKKGRKCEQSEELTSTPYKQELEAKQNMKQEQCAAKRKINSTENKGKKQKNIPKKTARKVKEPRTICEPEKISEKNNVNKVEHIPQTVEEAIGEEFENFCFM